MERSCKERMIWLDDFRLPDYFLADDREVIWLKNYKDFCSYIEQNGIPSLVCFDHDLGEEKSGYDCAKWLVDYCREKDIDLPETYIQSANPVGRENIIGILECYRKFYKNNHS